MNRRLLGSIIAGFSTFFAVILSGILIWEHRKAWKEPQKQKYIVNIILMVPIFAINSFVGLLELEGPEWLFMLLDSIKEIYEAYVIWSFLKLMFAYLKVEKTQKVPDHLKGREFHLSFPFNHLWTAITGEKHAHMNETALHHLELWTWQFVVLRPICSVLGIGAELLGKYDYVYWIIMITLNISVTLAVYALVVFYHAFAEELKEHRPLAQFICIKGVVLFAFWQACILSAFEHFGIIHANHWYTVAELDVAIQNFLVCLEMGGFALGHIYAFTAAPYQSSNQKAKKTT